MEHTYVCQPATERGRGILIGGDAATSTITYCNAKLVILRSLADPLHADVYDQHSHNTTVARISPNGEWVASGDVAGHVRVWARKPELDHKLKLEIKALGGSIDDLQWSVDGQRILVAGDGKNAQPARCFMSAPHPSLVTLIKHRSLSRTHHYFLASVIKSEKSRCMWRRRLTRVTRAAFLVVPDGTRETMWAVSRGIPSGL